MRPLEDKKLTFDIFCSLQHCSLLPSAGVMRTKCYQELKTGSATTNMLPTKDPLQLQGHTQAQKEGIEKILHTNGKQKRKGVTTLESNKIHFK